MIKYDQTIFNDPDNGIVGNCFQACTAGVLDLPLEEVPHFVADKTPYTGWPFNLDVWLSKRGLFFLYAKFPGGPDMLSEYWGYHLICGDGPRGARHSVVGYNGDLFHDPHPSRDGLLGNPSDWFYEFFVKKLV